VGFYVYFGGNFLTSKEMKIPRKLGKNGKLKCLNFDTSQKFEDFKKFES
jgi:hypothetical protein